MTIENIQKVLNIVGQYVDLDKEYLSAEHDIIYTPLYSDVVSIEDKERLEQLGAHIDSDDDCWAIFT